MAGDFRALGDKDTVVGFSQSRLQDPGADAANRRANLDLQVELEGLTRSIAQLRETTQSPTYTFRADIEAGAATAVPANDTLSVTVDGDDLTVAYSVALESTRRVFLANQIGGSLLEYRMADNGDLQTRISAFDQAGVPVSLATGTHSVALEVWS